MHTQQWRQRQRDRREEVDILDRLDCRDPALDRFFMEEAPEYNVASDCPEQPNEELIGLTIRTLEDLEED